MASSRQVGLNGPALVEPGLIAKCETGEPGANGYPDHLEPCDCDNHTGVCTECRFHVTVTPDRVELGHGRARDRSGDLPDCPHRPPEVDPTSMDHGNCIRCGRVMQRTTVLEVCVVCEDEDEQPSLADYVGGEPA